MAALYLVVPGSLGGMRPNSFEDAFYFSVQTMSTIGYGTLVPANRWAHVLVIIQARDGVPHLMVRLANWRHNQVVEAQIRMYMLVIERSCEGEVLRRPIELTLVRDRTPMFMLTFIAMHRIDASSPLASEAQRQRLAADGVDLVVAFTGLDETLGQQIHARHTYPVKEIVWGARFVDIITTNSDGTREIDYSQFHEVVAVELPIMDSAAVS